MIREGTYLFSRLAALPQEPDEKALGPEKRRAGIWESFLCPALATQSPVKLYPWKEDWSLFFGVQPQGGRKTPEKKYLCGVFRQPGPFAVSWRGKEPQSVLSWQGLADRDQGWLSRLQVCMWWDKVGSVHLELCLSPGRMEPHHRNSAMLWGRLRHPSQALPLSEQQKG